MTLKLRFALLLSLLLGGFVVAVVVLRGLEQAEQAAMVRGDREARIQLLNHWVEATTRTLPQFAADMVQRDELKALLQPAQPDGAQEKLSASLTGAGAAWLWVLREDGTPRLHVAASGNEPAAAPPLAASDFLALVAETPSPRFFAELSAGLVELCVRGIAASETGGAREWLIVARPWSEAQLRLLAALTESRVTLAGRDALARPPGDGALLELVRPLTDWRGQILRVLRLEYTVPEIGQAVAASARQSHVFIGYGLLLMLALGLALYQWVLRPVRQLSDSLVAQNPALVGDLSRDPSEFGRLAGLVVSSFAQRTALEHEVAERRRAQEALERSEASLRENLAERARLGRDLHDGVIQSLYAAGMGLAGIRAQLTPAQADAASRLEQTRAALNETIHDVRNFIIGLEPQALQLQTFSQAIAALLDIMRGMRPFEATIDVDEAVANALTLAQRVHALQIAREAVSNALRHGEAGRIGIALRRHGASVEFEITDDGQGFDEDASPRGKGLANFAERARELGGELSVASHPGKGTRVKLSFAPLHYD